MRRVALVAGHFVPSNLAAVHRARLWSLHLPEFGWEPTIVTTHPRHYEERLDPELEALVPQGLRIIRTPALPTRPVRVVGDIGMRALPFHYRALADLARAGEMDFLHITIPSNYSALLGRPIHDRFGVPYGIDYIDPWVHAYPGTEQPLSKAWATLRLAERLEPWAVRDARLITGVAPLYYEPVLERHPHLRTQAVTAAMPYGGSERDVEMAQDAGRTPYLFDPKDGLFHLMYAGAMLPQAYVVLERLLSAVKTLRTEAPEVGERLRVHFIGTGKAPDDPHGHNIVPYVERFGLQGVVDEHPTRIPYLDVLTHLAHASAVLVLGSTEKHYTPSKAFQAVLARRPVLAVLHEQSTAAQLLRRARAASVVSFAEGKLPQVAALRDALAQLVRGEGPSLDEVRWEEFEQHSARASARALASALDQATSA